MSGSSPGGYRLEGELRGTLERAVYWYLLSAELTGSLMGEQLGITSYLNVDLLEEFGRRLSACARAMRVAEGAGALPVDGTDPDLVELLDVFITEIEGEDRDEVDDHVLDAGRLVLLGRIRDLAASKEPRPEPRVAGGARPIWPSPIISVSVPAATTKAVLAGAVGQHLAMMQEGTIVPALERLFGIDGYLVDGGSADRLIDEHSHMTVQAREAERALLRLGALVPGEGATVDLPSGMLKSALEGALQYLVETHVAKGPSETCSQRQVAEATIVASDLLETVEELISPADAPESIGTSIEPAETVRGSLNERRC